MTHNMEIQMKRGVMLIDEADAHLITGTPYVTGAGYAYMIKDKKAVRVHRLIMDAQPGQEVDHINGNKLDNRRSNLRFVTRSENNRNVATRRNKASRYKGVQREDSRWRAMIQVNKKPIYLGCFNTEEEAALAYNRAALQYHGEYAWMNTVESSVEAA